MRYFLVDNIVKENRYKKTLDSRVIYSVNFLVDILPIDSTVAELMFIRELESRLSKDITIIESYVRNELTDLRMLLLNRMYTTRSHTSFICFCVGFLYKFFTYLNRFLYKLLNFLSYFLLFSIFQLIILHEYIQHRLISSLFF